MGTSFFDLSFYFNFLYFLFALFFAFYIPGFLFLNKLQLNTFQKSVLSLIVGMVLWGWQGMIFGYLGFRWLTYAYLLIAFFLWIKIVIKNKKILYFKRTNFNWLYFLIISLGVLVQLTMVWFTGISSKAGISFCCGNESDALYHAALTKQIVDRFPPFEPGMFGQVVENYHYWSNLVVAELIRIFYLPLFATQFQYSVVFVSIFLGLTVVVFGQVINAKKSFISWLLFFLYFGGDLTYFALHIFGTGINFNVSSLEDGAKFLINPPRAFSIVIFFAGLSLLKIWIKNKNFLAGILVSLVMGSLIGFKVYTGIFALTGLAFLGLYFLFKKNLKMILPIILSFLFSLIIYLPVNKSSGGLYFTGLWTFENFRTIKEFRLEGQEYAKLLYYQHHNWPRIILTELFFALLYIVSVFGSKLVALIQTRKSMSILSKELHIFLIPSLVLSLILGLFFQQSSGGSNSFNFLVSVFLIGSIYSALTIVYLIKNISRKTIKVFLVTLIVLITVPRVAYQTYDNFKRIIRKDFFIIKNSEINTYEYLNKNSNFNSFIMINDEGVGTKSPYASLFVNKPIFFSGREILLSHNVNLLKRQKVKDEILYGKNWIKVKKNLMENKINFVVMINSSNFWSLHPEYFSKKIFNNSDFKVFKVW